MVNIGNGGGGLHNNKIGGVRSKNTAKIKKSKKFEKRRFYLNRSFLPSSKKFGKIGMTHICRHFKTFL